MLYLRAELAREYAERQSYAAVLAAVDAQILAAEARDIDKRATSGAGVAWAHEAERRLAEIPGSRRGWEWRYLVGRLDGSARTLWGTTVPLTVAAGSTEPGDTSTIPYLSWSDSILPRPTIAVSDNYSGCPPLHPPSGNRAKAARLLGTTERILSYKVRGYAIDPRRFRG